jgi:hypothetical protein
MKRPTQYAVIILPILLITLAFTWVSLKLDNMHNAFRTICEAKGGVVVLAADRVCIRKQAIIEIEK